MPSRKTRSYKPIDPSSYEFYFITFTTLDAEIVHSSEADNFEDIVDKIGINKFNILTFVEEIHYHTEDGNWHEWCSWTALK